MTKKFTITGVRRLNERSVLHNVMLHKYAPAGMEVKRQDNHLMGDESESYTLKTDETGGHGINIKRLIGGNIVVELPERASENDALFCRAFLNAVKKTHRASRIMDEEDKDVRLVSDFYRSHSSGADGIGFTHAETDGTDKQEPSSIVGEEKKKSHNTFIMRWNTDISSYKMWEFEEAMPDFDEEGFYFDWSIWDYKKVQIGDIFYMIRTGGEKNGVVMRGTFIGTPYQDEDWSGQGRKVFYIRMSLTHMIHPDKSPALLTVEKLNEEIPGFNWSNGHSGEMLSQNQASLLEKLWQDYVDEVHQLFSEGKMGNVHCPAYKEKGWGKMEYNRPDEEPDDPVTGAEDFFFNIIFGRKDK